MHETQTQEPSPEELIVRDLGTDADRALEQYGRPVPEDMMPEGCEGTMDRAVSPTGYLLTRATAPDGATSYQLAAMWHSTEDRGSVNHRWQRGGDVIARSYSSEMNGDTDEEALESEDMPLVADSLNNAYPDKPAESARRFRGGRPRPAGRHRAVGQSTAEQGTEQDDTAAGSEEPRIDEGELAVIGDAAEPSPEDEEAERAAEYERRLSSAEVQIDAWAEDPTIKWRPNDRKVNPEGNRYIEYPVPSDDGKSWLQSRVAVIDEPGKDRWYVMHVTHGESTLVIYWQKGGELVRARRADRKDPHEANLGEMGLVQKVTDPEQARIKRKTGASAEGLESGSRVAHRIGRLLGSKTVTRWK